MKIAVVGLGLIGGSLAKAIKHKTSFEVDGYDICNTTVKAAIGDGIITQRCSGYQKYDIILVALYPHDTITFLENHVSEFSKNTLVIDCAGVKEIICSRANELFKQSQAIFIGGHPMAGKEASNYENSSSELFFGASMILTPESNTPKKAIKKAEDFFELLGFARVTLSTPEEHDRIIAYTSQLAHVVSSAYMLSPTAESFMGFSAGSFADLTRVAKLNPEMWSELFITNKKALTCEIDNIIENLQQFRNYINDSNSCQLKTKLKIGSDIKERLNQK